MFNLMTSHLVTFHGAFNINTMDVILVNQTLRNVEMGGADTFVSFPDENVPPEAELSGTKGRTRKGTHSKSPKPSTCLCVSIQTPQKSDLKGGLPGMVGFSSC